MRAAAFALLLCAAVWRIAALAPPPAARLPAAGKPRCAACAPAGGFRMTASLPAPLPTAPPLTLSREAMLEEYDRTSFSSRSRLLAASAVVGFVTGVVVSLLGLVVLSTASTPPPDADSQHTERSSRTLVNMTSHV